MSECKNFPLNCSLVFRGHSSVIYVEEFISIDVKIFSAIRVMPVAGESAGMPCVRCASISSREAFEFMIELGLGLNTVFVIKTDISVQAI